MKCKLQFLFNSSKKCCNIDEVFSLTTSLLAVYLLFRLTPFARRRIICATDCFASCRTSPKACSHTRVCRRNCSLCFGHANVAFWGQLESGSSDILDSPFQFFEAWLPGTAGQARFPAKKKHTFCLFRLNRILFILLLGAE